MNEPGHHEPTQPCDHLVQVYRRPHELAETVAAHLADGFEAGEAAVVVATKAHWPLFAERLASAGWDPAELEARGLLHRVDAEETLAAILDGRMPSKQRFDDVVGGLIERAIADSGTETVRAFGEMVDILCRRGDGRAADALEGLWNELRTRLEFTLLCGYKLDLFDRESQLSLLPRVYAAHSEVVAGDEARLADAVEAALRSVLGESGTNEVYEQVASQDGDPHVPMSQRVLMWVSAAMPKAAERVLTAARVNYGAAGAA
jgi:hypothetical protein